MFPLPGQRAAEATAHVEAYADDARCRRITAWESLWNGTAHNDKPSFWDRSVPLIERRPAVNAGLLSTAGRRLAHMVFGERSFPSLHIEDTAYGVALTEFERDALSALVAEVVRAAKLKSRARAYLLEGLKTGAACALCEIREGRPFVTLIPSKWCTPTPDGLGRVLRLVVQYKHTGADGHAWWYRREIDATADVVRAAVPVDRDPRKLPDWSTVAVASSRPLTFCPVVWTRNAPEAVEDGHGHDGHPLCEGIEDELLAADLELSQLLRNALYNGDPQMVRTGVGGEAAPMGAAGREASSASLWSTAANGAREVWQRVSGVSSAAATKKAPGTIWNLPTGGDAKLLESTGAGAQIIKGAFDEIKRAIVDSMGVVLADPQALGSGDLSARALSLMFGPMIDTASALRVDYGDAVCEIISHLCRLAALADGSVYLASLDAARSALAKLSLPSASGPALWLGLPVACAWGEFFDPGWADIKNAIDTARAATGDSRVLSRRAALKLIAPVVGIEDTEAEAEAIDAEDGVSQGAVSDTLARLAEPADDAPDVTIEDPAMGMAAAVSDTALNGAQVASMVEIVEKVVAGTLPRGAARAIIMRAFAVDAAGADDILGDAGQGFTPMAKAAPADAV